jgi:hypothetical protein
MYSASPSGFAGEHSRYRRRKLEQQEFSTTMAGTTGTACSIR